MNRCDNCEQVASRLYNVSDEGYCEDCFNYAVSQSDLAYEASKEDM